MELMIKNTKRAFILVLALFFMVLGLAGFVLPVIPGIVFVALSVALLSIFSPAVQEMVHKRTVKYPKIHSIVLKMDDRIRRIVGDI